MLSILAVQPRGPEFKSQHLYNKQGTCPHKPITQHSQGQRQDTWWDFLDASLTEKSKLQVQGETHRV